MVRQAILVRVSQVGDALEDVAGRLGAETRQGRESPIEGGTYLERCEGCSLRPRCNGMRSDYVAIHGDDEFQPQS